MGPWDPEFNRVNRMLNDECWESGILGNVGKNDGKMKKKIIQNSKIEIFKISLKFVMPMTMTYDYDYLTILPMNDILILGPTPTNSDLVLFIRL